MPDTPFYHRWFVRELAQCTDLLVRVQESTPRLARFKNWTKVTESFATPRFSQKSRNLVLTSIFAAWRADGDPRWQVVLICLFWSTLLKWHFFKQRWHPATDHRWHDLLVAFIEVIDSFDVNEHPNDLTKCLLGRAANKCRTIDRRIWRLKKRQRKCVLTQMPDPRIPFKWLMIECKDKRQCLKNALRELVNARQLTDVAYTLIVSTRLKGHSLADVARRLGLQYETAKKRRRRSEVSLKKKLMKKILKFGGNSGTN